MSVREYVGARYVPLMLGDWDNTKTYEPLSVVLYQGNSYTSRQYVPAGIDIANDAYWASTGNYNAQVDAYRAEVQAYDGRITANADDIDAIEDVLPISAFDSVNTVDARFDTIEANDWVVANRIASNAVTTTKIADSAVTTAKIDDGAVTAAKVASSAVTTAKINDNAVTFDKTSSAVERYIRNATRATRNTVIVCIGDSYGRGVGGTTDQGWPYYIERWGRPTSILNVSNSGAGFIATGHSDGMNGLNFSDQLDYAVSHLPVGIAVEDVDIVIIGGGYNDHSQSGQYQASYDTIRKAQNDFPNAAIHFFPMCVGDRSLNNEYVSNYIKLCHGAAEAGAQTHDEALYWLYPFEIGSSAGDNIHPNDTGYRWLAALILGTLAGGTYLAHTITFAESAEGFAFDEDATNNNFRAFVQNGVAYFGGRIDRTGYGVLCTLPSYCRPRQTTYIPMFVYADSDHHGIARCRLYANGQLEFMTLESGTYDASLTWQCFIPCTAMPLGHIIF